jgi:hypothetical protein
LVVLPIELLIKADQTQQLLSLHQQHQILILSGVGLLSHGLPYPVVVAEEVQI